jgi:hypothetical protein
MPSLREARIHPAVQDALSGAFRPIIDAEKRAHTLSRLTMSSFVRGQYVDVPTHGLRRDDKSLSKRYRPSWSPHVDVHTHWRREEERGMSEIFKDFPFTLQFLSLEDPYGTKLQVTTDQFSKTLFLRGVAKLELPLELGPDLANTQDAVAEAALSFFDTSAQALARHVDTAVLF